MDGLILWICVVMNLLAIPQSLLYTVVESGGTEKHSAGFKYCQSQISKHLKGRLKNHEILQKGIAVYFVWFLIFSLTFNLCVIISGSKFSLKYAWINAALPAYCSLPPLIPQVGELPFYPSLSPSFPRQDSVTDAPLTFSLPASPETSVSHLPHLHSQSSPTFPSLSLHSLLSIPFS